MVSSSLALIPSALRAAVIFCVPAAASPSPSDSARMLRAASAYVATCFGVGFGSIGRLASIVSVTMRWMAARTCLSVKGAAWRWPSRSASMRAAKASWRAVMKYGFLSPPVARVYQRTTARSICSCCGGSSARASAGALRKSAMARAARRMRP